MGCSSSSSTARPLAALQQAKELETSFAGSGAETGEAFAAALRPFSAPDQEVKVDIFVDISVSLRNGFGEVDISSSPGFGEAMAPRRPEPFTPRTAPSLSAEADLDHYQDSMRLLDLDLGRTYAGDPEIQSRRCVLREMLLRRLADDPEVGYCQGLSFWAAPFAVACENKHEAYARFLGLTRRMRSLWLPGLPLLRDGSELFAAAADGRPWFRHLEAQGVDTSMYLPQVWCALFAQWLPMASLLQCLPFLERRGFEGVLALTLAALEREGPELLRLTGIEEILPALSGMRQRKVHPEISGLIAEAGQWIPLLSPDAESPLAL